MRKILIIGICGGLAQILSRIVLTEHPDWQIIGIDSRSTDSVTPIEGLTTINMKYSRGNFEKLFRDNTFDTVFHLARITHSSNSNNTLAARLELSVMGTNRILDLCLRFKVKKVVILSTFHVYGALPDNAVFLPEDSPLRASMKNPDLRDVVEMDQICTNWMWKYQHQMSTVVLRPCNIIGSQIQNSMTKYLTSQFALRPIDFNPVFQFIHEFDMSKVLAFSLDNLPSGIYNVAGDDFISLRHALDLVGVKGIPFPITIASAVNRVLKTAKLEVPDYLIDYLKYSCLIDNSTLKKFTGPNFFRFNIEETLKLIKLA